MIEIQTQLRVIKERARATRIVRPSLKIPVCIIFDLINQTVIYINTFPHKIGISETLSPSAIMTVTSLA